MTDENERDIRDDAMTLQSNGSLWVLADDYRALLARAEAAEAKLAAARGGVAAIAAERQRQMDVEGWTPEHDDLHYDDELACAAICYLRHSPVLCAPEAPPDWPWDERWWKPKSRRADLVRAGALVAAEIDRIDRAALRALTEERNDG